METYISEQKYLTTDLPCGCESRGWVMSRAKDEDLR